MGMGGPSDGVLRFASSLDSSGTGAVRPSVVQHSGRHQDKAHPVLQHSSSVIQQVPSSPNVVQPGTAPASISVPVISLANNSANGNTNPFFAGINISIPGMTSLTLPVGPTADTSQSNLPQSPTVPPSNSNKDGRSIVTSLDGGIKITIPPVSPANGNKAECPVGGVPLVPSTVGKFSVSVGGANSAGNGTSPAHHYGNVDNSFSISKCNPQSISIAPPVNTAEDSDEDYDA